MTDLPKRSSRKSDLRRWLIEHPDVALPEGAVHEIWGQAAPSVVATLRKWVDDGLLWQPQAYHYQLAPGQKVIKPHPGPQTQFLTLGVDGPRGREPVDMILYGGAVGGGKRLCDDTLVPTPTGWARHGELQVGDYVLDENGAPTRVVHVHPVELEPEAYRVTFRGGEHIDADAGHLWLVFPVDSGEGDRGRIFRTREVRWLLGEFGQQCTPEVGALDGSGALRTCGKLRPIESIEPISPKPMRCITVEAPSGLYQVGRSHIVTHNSWVLIYQAVLHAVSTPGWTGLICRNTQRDLKQAKGIWELGKEFATLTGGRYREGNELDIRWDGGGRLVFDYLAENKYERYRGAQLAYVGIDEANECPMEGIIFLFTRMRTTCGVRPIMRLSCNPDPNHPLAKWVDPFYLIDGGEEDGRPDRAVSGTVRYFARNPESNEFVFGPTREVVALESGRDPAESKTFAFINADLNDNPTIAGDEQQRASYIAGIALQSGATEEQLRFGNWRASNERPGILAPEYWGGGVDMVEPISPIVRWVRAWDLASSEPRPEYPDPDYTAGVLMGFDAFGRFYVADLALCREEGPGVDALLAKTAHEDGPDVVQVIEKEGGSSGKRDILTTKRVLRSRGNCGRIVDVKPVRSSRSSDGRKGNPKVAKTRGLANALQLGMVGNRPREHAEGKGPWAPRGFLLNASGWMTREYRDAGNHLPTLLKVFWQQTRPFPSPVDLGTGKKIHDDIPDGMGIAYNEGAKSPTKRKPAVQRWKLLS